MSAQITPHDGSPLSREGIERRLRAEASDVHAWSNAPGDRYGQHQHPYTKVLYCASGSIAFVLSDGSTLDLRAGDRLVLPPGIRHGAVVGPDGCTCLEGRA